MTTLVAIDPGLRCLGVAVFEDGQLEATYLVKNPNTKGRGPEAWRAYGQDDSLCGLVTELADVVVVELQQIYKTTKNPDDMLQVNGVAGTLSGWSNVEVFGYLPRQWKGSVPKAVHHPRILKKLSPEERATIPKLPKSLLHNCLDAIGLGLYHLER